MKLLRRQILHLAGVGAAVAVLTVTLSSHGAWSQPSRTIKAAPDVQPTQQLTRDAALGSSARVPIVTPSLGGSIALAGGRIDDLVLSKYHETVDPKSPEVVLFSPAGAPHPYYAEYGWVDAAGTQPMPGRETVWRAEKDTPLTPASPVTLIWDNGQGLIFRRTIAVDADYLFTVTDEVQNKTSGSVTLHPYSLISRHGTPPTSGYYILHEGPIGVMGDAGLQEPNYADLLKDGGTKTFKQTAGWLGMTDKYWGAALIPDQKTAYDAKISGTKGVREYFQTDFLMAGTAISPGGRGLSISSLFAGAKQVALLEAYREKLQVKNFDLLIDWGWFYFITKPLFWVIDLMFKGLGNFGLAILAVTVLIKIVFFPFANKSYHSMIKMQRLQPHIAALRERFPGQAQANKEIIELYKRENVTAPSGCLPILIQVLVFFALYKVLFVTIEMRHAPFFGWIRDLSVPDPTSLFNLFGLLPYQVPDMLHIGAWPIILGLTLWSLQQKISPVLLGSFQRAVYAFLPVLAAYFSAGMIAGLIISFTGYNILSIFHQLLLMGRRRDAVGNIYDPSINVLPYGKIQPIVFLMMLAPITQNMVTLLVFWRRSKRPRTQNDMLETRLSL